MTRGGDANDLRPTAVVAEPSALFRAGLRRMLERRGVEVVGEADSRRSVARVLDEGGADVALVAEELLRELGSPALRLLSPADARPRVVALLGEPGGEAARLLRDGASGCVLKGAQPDEVALAVHAVAAGRCYVAPALSSDVVEALRFGISAEHPEGLTERELAVLRFAAQGLENRAIAEALHISLSTVKGHLASVQRRLGVDNRVQAAVEAVRRGLA